MVCFIKKKMEENNNPSENGLVIQIFRNQMPPLWPQYSYILQDKVNYSLHALQNANAVL